MPRFFAFLLFLLLLPPAHAWNAAGHRIVAAIAWQQLSPASRTAIDAALAQHPDARLWAERAKSSAPDARFFEAATWPDDIRRDPRFYDEDHEPPTPALPGLPDTARHKRWHYVDLDDAGRVREGELDRQIDRLTTLLRSTGKIDEISNALPWLVHLVADIHQPLHVGRHGDEGGNQLEIENPFNRRRPFGNLHQYWDDLPGPPWLRGKRLAQTVASLLDSVPPPRPGDTLRWREESRALHGASYPTMQGSLLPLVDEAFLTRSRRIADQQLVAAGYRLGWLLESIFSERISRGRP